MIPLLSADECVRGGGEDPPSPSCVCVRSKEVVPWVDRDDWYAMYKSLSKLLCCETCTIILGRFWGKCKEVGPKMSDVPLLWFGEMLLFVLWEGVSLICLVSGLCNLTAVSLVVQSLFAPSRLRLRLCCLGLWEILLWLDESFRSQAFTAAVFTFLLGCWLTISAY